MDPFSRLTAVMSALALNALSAQAAEFDPEIAYNNHCRKCHSTKEGDNRLGPTLYGIVGAKAGQVPGFSAYSGGLAGITWDEAMLDKFIADPASVASSTNMIYPPVKDPAERKAIIEFLKRTGDKAQAP
jgi:cytochrome c